MALTKREEKQLAKGRQQSQKARAKAEKKPAKTAQKQTNKEMNRRQAAVRLRKTQAHFWDLPPVLWPLVAVVTFIWARNTWEKERRERDLREARRFLHESRGFRL